ELEDFARHFKQSRIRLGYTQADVGQTLGDLYGSLFSQTTICRFEALQLSVRNMTKLKPLMEKWLEDVDKNNLDAKSPSTFQFCTKQRKKRTSIDSLTRKILENEFRMKNKPTAREIAKIANNLQKERETIRIWFCNRRQKEKRI
ncbi:hypothetical protein HELRODRAFT_135367, partial [Helobdella robusta]|uniref:POU domain protein n=1 Tax=Helobdella robusta TaxID=6412 RepID=T1EI82_HELRO